MLKFIIILTPSLAWGYGLKDIDLTSYEFNRYVRPQLISITQDYQSLVTQLNPEISDFKPFFNVYRDMVKESQNLKKYCHNKEINLDCQKVLERSIKILAKGDSLAARRINFSDKPYFSPDDVIVALSAQSRFFNHYTSLQMKYQNIYYLYLAHTDKGLDFIKLRTELLESYMLFSDFILKSSDQRFFEEFKTFWSDFIKPVKLHILPENDQKLFVQKLNDFNLRLNFLNVVLTKRNHPINKQSKTLVKLIHNRWNNILKVTLKRQR